MVWESHVDIFCLFNKYTVNGRVNKYVTFFQKKKKIKSRPISSFN